MATVHVIGAGISGLAAATALAERGVPVKLYEAATSAGGRCRSSRDPHLGSIDHGLHVFSGSAKELQRFIRRIDARDEFLRIPSRLKLADGMHPARLSMSLGDAMLLAGNVAQAPADMRATDLLPDHSPLQDTLIAPLSRLALTSLPHALPVRALRRYLRRQLGRGMRRLYMAKYSLSESFIAPALKHLEYHGGSVYFGQALKSVQWGEGGADTLHFGRKKLALMPDDVLIFATPPALAQSVIPGLAAPQASHSAITLHFSTEHRETLGSVLVLTNAPADLLRYDAGAIRATIRLADHAWHGDEDLLVARLWKFLQQLHPYLRGHPLPEWASWREKRAGHQLQGTPLPTPHLPPRCLLAGDWLDATQPGTLEAAAHSGHRAAEAALALLGKYPQPSQYDFYLN